MTGAAERLNPLVLILVGLTSLIGSLAVRDLTIALITLGAYATVIVLAVPRPMFVLVCLAFSAFAGLTVAYSTWRLGGRDLERAAVVGLRIVVLAWPGSVAAGFVDPGRLGDYLAQSLRLPARGVAAFSAALQRFTGLVQLWGELERTRRARGLSPGGRPIATVRHSGAMAFGLLVQTMRAASQTSIAMDARGFADADRRTWAEPATWSRLDLVAVAVSVGLGALPICLLVLR